MPIAPLTADISFKQRTDMALFAPFETLSEMDIVSHE
jgi:hypothetical protein